MRKLLFAGIALAVAWGVFRPAPPPDLFWHSDKLGHLLGFMALGLGARLAWSRGPAAWCWGALLLAAPALEWLQPVVSPLRQRSLGDALANVLGVLLALALWRLWRWWSARQRARTPNAPS